MEYIKKRILTYALMVTHSIYCMDSTGRLTRRINNPREITLAQVLQKLREEERTPSTRWTTDEWEQLHEDRVRLEALLGAYSSLQNMVNNSFVTILHQPNPANHDEYE